MNRMSEASKKLQETQNIILVVMEMKNAAVGLERAELEGVCMEYLAEAKHFLSLALHHTEAIEAILRQDT